LLRAPHLRSALEKYGVDNFVFIIVEFFEPNPNVDMKENKSHLLAREQLYLDWLFSRSSELRYNFLPTAGSSLGYKHTEKAKAKISMAMKSPDRTHSGGGTT
jgi:group I intron endonuclease